MENNCHLIITYNFKLSLDNHIFIEHFIISIKNVVLYNKIFKTNIQLYKRYKYINSEIDLIIYKQFKNKLTS